MNLVDSNPDDTEIMKLRPKLEEAKLFKKRLQKENRNLRETFKKYNYIVVSAIDEGD